MAWRFEDWAETPTPKEFNDALTCSCRRSWHSSCTRQVNGLEGRAATKNGIREAIRSREVMRIGDQEVHGLAPALFHAYSQIVNLWLATTVGARVVYLTN